MPDDRATPFELFNEAIESLRRGELTDAVMLLRGGFFENLYITPLLIGEEFHLQRIWYPSADSEPQAAREYVNRYGHLWRSQPIAFTFLRALWNDSLVRAELRSFINLSKNILSADSESRLADLVEERELFLSPERLRRTQSEILSRLESINLELPGPGPRLGLIMLASRDPQVSVDFYRKLLEIEPRAASRAASGYVEFDFEGVHFGIHGLSQVASSDPYRLGPSPSSLGWGAVFVLSVGDFDRYYRNAIAARFEIIDSDLTTAGHRYMVVKDPSGYVLEITEESPRGFDPA